jgi:hypothetical protein
MTNTLSGNWTPDLFNGAGKLREPGKDRADDLRRAGQEMPPNSAPFPSAVVVFWGEFRKKNVLTKLAADEAV